MRVIGLDLGSKTLGVAIASDEVSFARAYANLSFRRGDYKFAVNAVKNIVDKEEIDTIVIGYPLNMNGTPSEGTRTVDEFIELMKKEGIDLPIFKIDERMTTIIAQQELHASNYHLKNMKGKIDMVAATKILDTFLERKKNHVLKR